MRKKSGLNSLNIKMVLFTVKRTEFFSTFNVFIIIKNSNHGTKIKTREAHGEENSNQQLITSLLQ